MTDENLCKSCFRSSETEPVQVKRDGQWVESPTVRRCTNPECHSIRAGTLRDRLEYVERIYSYKYFGDYELSPEQLDAVMEANGIAQCVPALLEALKDVLGIIHTVCPEYDEATMCANARAAIAQAEGCQSPEIGA